MPSDFRVSVGFHDHPKTVKLERALPGTPMNLQRLWGHATEFKPSGVLSGMDAEDIAIAAKWMGEPELFVETLVRLRWLDRLDDGTLALHDWAEHNGFVASAPARSEKAREAAAARWKKKGDGGKPPGEGRNARGANEQCASHPGAMPNEESANAPSPSPSPNPDPSPPPMTERADPWEGFDGESRTLLEGAAKGLMMSGYELPLRLLRQLEARAGQGKVSEGVPGLWASMPLADKARWCAVAFEKTRQANVTGAKVLAYAASVVGSALEGGTALADEAPKVVDPEMATRPWYGLWCRHVKKAAEPRESEVWNFGDALGLNQADWHHAWAIAKRDGPMAAGDWAWEKRRDVA